MITVLAGGVGAAKFLEGLAAVMPPEQITVIVNTGDDAEFHGLHVSPDMDTVLYTLAGVVNRETGWGIAGDTFSVLKALEGLGAEAWFRLGDRDIATHLYRTSRLREGATLAEVSCELCRRLNVRSTILPMSNDPCPTRLLTSAGEMPFQEYFVKLRQEPEVLAVDLSAAGRSRPAPGVPGPGVIEAIMNATGVIVAPSNPIISIGPILAVPGLREALRRTPAPVAAISPIVGGKALKGPADRMMRSLGFGSSAAAVAGIYSDFVDVFVLDEQDAALQTEVQNKGMAAVAAPTLMNSNQAKRVLAGVLLDSLKASQRSVGGAGRAK